jgi:hypothetical protein
MPYTGSIATLLLPVDLTTGALSGTAGTYTVTITKVIDRITEKALNLASLAGTINAARNTYSIGIIPAPVTQPIQHIRNL